VGTPQISNKASKNILSENKQFKFLNRMKFMAQKTWPTMKEYFFYFFCHGPLNHLSGFSISEIKVKESPT